MGKTKIKTNNIFPMQKLVLFEQPSARETATFDLLSTSLEKLENKLKNFQNNFLSIDISGKALPPKVMERLAKFLYPYSPRIKILYMNDILVGLPDEEAESSLSVLNDTLTKKNNHLNLEELYLFDNALGQDGLERIKDILLCSFPTLKVLDISNIGFSVEACKLMKQYCLKEDSSFPLTTLLCDNNYLSNEGCEDFSFILSCFKDLKSLRLSSCRLTHDGLIPVLNSIKDLSMEELDLSDCLLDEECMELISRIACNTNIEVLNLSMTCLTQYTLQRLVSLNQNTKSIRTLNISDNSY